MIAMKFLANQVLMSIAAAVCYTISQLNGFHRVARVGAGFIDNDTLVHET